MANFWLASTVSPGSAGTGVTYNEAISPTKKPETVKSGAGRFVKLSVELCPRSEASIKSALFGTGGGDTSTTKDKAELVFETFPAESKIT